MANDFFKIGGKIMQNSRKLRGFPVTIIHGGMDFCCPVSMAWDLKQKLPRADLIIAPHDGHGGKMCDRLFRRAVAVAAKAGAAG